MLKLRFLRMTGTAKKVATGFLQLCTMLQAREFTLIYPSSDTWFGHASNCRRYDYFS